MRRARTTAPIAMAFLTGFAGLAIWAAHISGFTSPEWSLILLTSLLVGYLLVEIQRVRRLHSTRWLLNPAVMCSVLTFMLGFGLTNFLYFLPEDQLSGLGVQPGVTHWMVNLLALVLLGAIAMWLAYWSPFAVGLGRKFQRNRFLNRLLRKDWNFRPDMMVLLVVISLASRLIAIRLGVYGYSSDAGRLSELGGITQYLSMTEGLGKLALVIAALRYFSPTGRTLQVALWFWGLLGYEILFGFLSGFKSQVAMPLVIAGVCMYMRRGRLPWRWVILVPVAISMAYAVIEPFRAARYQDKAFEGTSLTYIAKTMKEAYSGGGTSRQEKGPGTTLSFLARSNYLQIGSLGIEYADSRPVPDSAPNFLLDIFLSPIYAVLPRALFEFKPLSNLGTWYRIEVIGIIGGNTSLAMGPFTYLYFAGGVIAVALGFFFIGIIQRAVTDVFLVSPKAGAAIPFLIVLPTLVAIDSSYYSIIISLVRYLPIALFLQRLIYRR